MKFDPIFTLVSLLAGAVPLGAVGAFFLFVSPLTILYVATIVMGMMFMFALGVLVADRKPDTEAEPEGRTEVGTTITSGPAAPAPGTAGPFFYRPE